MLPGDFFMLPVQLNNHGFGRHGFWINHWNHILRRGKTEDLHLGVLSDLLPACAHVCAVCTHLLSRWLLVVGLEHGVELWVHVALPISQFNALLLHFFLSLGPLIEFLLQGRLRCLLYRAFVDEPTAVSLELFLDSFQFLWQVARHIIDVKVSLLSPVVIQTVLGWNYASAFSHWACFSKTLLFHTFQIFVHKVSVIWIWKRNRLRQRGESRNTLFKCIV